MSKILMSTKPLLGCIADDFTGATDLASFLVKSGMRTLQLNGLEAVAAEQARLSADGECAEPDASPLADFDAVVIALKSRTTPVQEAVDDSLGALQFLRTLACQKFYFKYCSTFDSFPHGNIGPVTDALLDALGESSTVVCPALPVNGRSVYQGYLFVHSQLLHESPMKDHPITPMSESSVVRMMAQQGKGQAVSVPMADVVQGSGHLSACLHRLKSQYRYLVIDAIDMEHLRTIGHACREFKLVTGGSGLALDLVQEFVQNGFSRRKLSQSVGPLPSPALVLSGSCSAMTRAQVARYSERSASLQLDPGKIARGEQTVEECIVWFKKLFNDEKSALVYSSADPEQVKSSQQKIGLQNSQSMLETFFGALAQHSVELGVKNIVVAGGETSGAVVKALGVHAFEIGDMIAPGVPMVRARLQGQSTEHDGLSSGINLVLKSGNFGDENFFEKAVETITC